MSARLNKKQRKGRNNANNRERTVTTLTEDPNTPYLVPTPSEEPAGTNLMSSPFSVAPSSAGNPNTTPSPSFQIPGNFGFGYNSFVGAMHGGTHQNQSQFFPQQQQPKLPSGHNDLEVLENLKKTIKNGQHPIYRAVPQPAALASIYLGTNPVVQSQVPHHPEQAPSDSYSADNPSAVHPSTGNLGPSSSVEMGRRPPRMQNKEGWDPSGPRKSVASSMADLQSTNNVPLASKPHSILSTNATIVAQTLLQGNRYNNGVPPMSSNGRADTSLTDMKAPDDMRLSKNANDGQDTPSRLARQDSLKGSYLRPTGGPPPSPKSDQIRSDDRLRRNESINNSDLRGIIKYPSSEALDGKDSTSHTTRDSAWSQRDNPPIPDDRRKESDRGSISLSASDPNGTRNSPEARPPVLGDRGDPRPPSPRDPRFLERERDRERDRDHDNRDWRPDPRGRPRPTDTRRPPPEQRHYEPDYDRPRRYGSREDSPPRRPLDVRPSLPVPVAGADDRVSRPFVPSENRRPSLDDRLPPARSVSDSRPIDSRPSHLDARPAPDSQATLDTRSSRGPSDDRYSRPVSADGRRSPPPGDRAARPTGSATATRPVDSLIAIAGRSGTDNRSGRPPAPLVDERSTNSRSQIPLEERISRPSLQDRLSQPPTTRSDLNRPGSQSSLEERISNPPVGRTDPGPRPVDDRLRQNASDRDRDRIPRPAAPDNRGRNATLESKSSRPTAGPEERSGRPTEGFSRGLTPTPSDPLSRPSTYPPPRSASVVRDDPRASKPPPSPLRTGDRDYRPAISRDISRPRSEVRPTTYRPSTDREYDTRRSDLMDIDAPSRYASETRPPYRHFSPPSAADLARDRDRARNQYAPPSPPPRALPPITDSASYDSPDRRYPPASGRDWQFQPYADRRREYPADEGSPYWKPPPGDRDRFDRDIAPLPVRNGGWEPRAERGREPYSHGSSPRSFDGPRTLGSRLADGYPNSGSGPDDRAYPPRDPGRSRPLTPPYSRIRPRSPSPVRRPGPIDDSRPPLKRPRDDPYSSDYYSARDPLRRAPVSDYPSRIASPPPSSGGSYYDRSGPPPPTSSTVGSNDRDYPGSRDYPPISSSYERARSPGPPRSQTYSRGAYGHPRDDRRYDMPPPPPRTA